MPKTPTLSIPRLILPEQTPKLSPREEANLSFASTGALFSKSFNAACGELLEAATSSNENNPNLVITGLLNVDDEEHWASYCRNAQSQDIDLERAVTFIYDAMEERRTPWLDDQVHLHRAYHHPATQALRSFAISCSFMHSAWVTSASSPISFLTWITGVILALFFLVHLFLQVHISGKKRYFGNNYRIFHLSCAVVFLLTSIYRPPSLQLIHALSQPLTTLGFSRSLCKVLMNTAACMQRLLAILFLITVILLAAAITAVLCFAPGNPNFQSVTGAMYHLAVAMTTVNFPDIMIPSYYQPIMVLKNTSALEIVGSHIRYQTTFDISSSPESVSTMDGAFINQWSSPLFFMGFMGFSLCFLLTIVFAIIYDFYKARLSGEVHSSYAFRQWMLKCAWCSLTSAQCPTITLETWRELFRLYAPKLPHDQVVALFLALNTSQTGELKFTDFRGLFHLLSLKINVVKEPVTWASLLPARVFSSCAVRRLVRFVQGLGFQVTMDVINICCVAVTAIHLELTYRWGWRYGEHPTWERLLWTQVFLGIPLDLELFLKVFFLGWLQYWNIRWNRVGLALSLGHAVLYLSLVVCTVYHSPQQALIWVTEDQGFGFTFPFSIILGLRLVRCFRLLSVYPTYKMIIKTASNVMPLFAPYFGALALAMYLFAIVGQYLLQGVHAEIDPYSAFAQNNYYGLNFDTVYSSFITIFTLAVVNNWQVIMEGYVSAVGNWIGLFFFVVYVAIVMVLLNVIAALVVEVFVSQYELNFTQKLAPRQNRYARRIMGAYRGMTRGQVAPIWEVRYRKYYYRVQVALEMMYCKEDQVLALDHSQTNSPTCMPFSGEPSTVLSSRHCFVEPVVTCYGSLNVTAD